MEIEFDPEKSARNKKERGLSFEQAAHMDWHKARIIRDERRDYGEERFTAYAPMNGRLHVACFTIRGEAFRIISFRKANKREEKAYEKASIDR
jgi:uncharacterized DUF497 family protein